MTDNTCPHLVPKDRWCPSCMTFIPIRAAALALVLLLGTACHPLPPPGPGGEGCEAACANLDRLGCSWRTSAGPDELAGTADDMPCASWCPAYEREGVDLHTGCVSAAASCDAASSCTEVGL